MNDREELLQCADWLEAGASLAMTAASKAQGEFAAKSLRELAALRLASQPSADVARMREALLTVKLMIQGEQIEAAIVDVGTMQPLGQVVAAAIDGVREAVKPCIHDNAAPVEGDMRLGKYEEQNPDSKTWTASIDVFRQYDYRNAAWHLSAIEFHHKDKNEVIALRNKAFAALAQTEGGKSSDGGVEVRHAETGNMPGSVPGEEVSSAAASLERPTVQGVALEPCAGVTPGPSEATPAPADDTTWFWEIVDREGFEGVPSDERDALNRIMNELRRLRTVQPAPADGAAVAWRERRERYVPIVGKHGEPWEETVQVYCTTCDKLLDTKRADDMEALTHPAKALDVEAVAQAQLSFDELEKWHNSEPLLTGDSVRVMRAAAADMLKGWKALNAGPGQTGGKSSPEGKSLHEKYDGNGRPRENGGFCS